MATLFPLIYLFFISLITSEAYSSGTSTETEVVVDIDFAYHAARQPRLAGYRTEDIASPSPCVCGLHSNGALPLERFRGSGSRKTCSRKSTSSPPVASIIFSNAAATSTEEKSSLKQSLQNALVLVQAALFYLFPDLLDDRCRPAFLHFPKCWNRLPPDLRMGVALYFAQLVGFPTRNKSEGISCSCPPGRFARSCARSIPHPGARRN